MRAMGAMPSSEEVEETRTGADRRSGAGTPLGRLAVAVLFAAGLLAGCAPEEKSPPPKGEPAKTAEQPKPPELAKPAEAAKPAAEPTKPVPPAKPAEPAKPAAEPAKPAAEPAKPAAEPPKPTAPPAKPAEPPKPAEAPVKSVKPAEVSPGVFVVEVESFHLWVAKVQDLANASGGKAVFFGEAGSSAEAAVDLPKGSYLAKAYAQAPDPKSDAFMLSVGGSQERVFPRSCNAILPTGKVAFEMKEAGPCKVKIETTETGFYVDRLVLMQREVASAPPARPGETVLEIEGFKLADAQVKELRGASGGKAVLFEKETSVAEGALEFKSGIYHLALFADAPGSVPAHVKLAVPGLFEGPTNPSDLQESVPDSRITLVVEKDGSYPVKLNGGRLGCCLDRLVVRRAEPVPDLKPAEGETVLEVESFKLDGAQVKEVAGTSGGKLVFFGEEAKGAETTVELKKGTYEITALMLAFSAEADAWMLKGPNLDERLYPAGPFGEMTPSRKVTLKVEQDGPCKLRIEPAERGYYLDRLVLRKVQ